MNGIVATHKMRKERIPILVEQVQVDELTTEEAAQCLAGATLKVIEEFGGNAGVDRDVLFRQALHDIESRLPDYSGIIVGRHI